MFQRSPVDLRIRLHTCLVVFSISQQHVQRETEWRVPGAERSESASRVNTPTPGNVGSDSSLFRRSLVPNSANSTINLPGYESSNDTELEEGGEGPATVFTSFNSYQTADTSPAISEQKLGHLNSPDESSSELRIRRPTSADRLTMRPSNTPRNSVPLPNSAPADIHVPSPSWVNTLADANNILNAFCSQQIYSNLYNPNYTSSDNESGDDQRRELTLPIDVASYPLRIELSGNQDKGKVKKLEYGAAHPGTIPTSEHLESPGFIPLGFKGLKPGLGGDGDEDRHCGTVSEGISDTDDNNIPTLIPSTSTLPPAPHQPFRVPVHRVGHSLRLYLIMTYRQTAAVPFGSSMVVDQRSLLTPTPTNSYTPLPATPSSASMSMSTSISSSNASPSSGVPDHTVTFQSRSRNVSPQPGHSSAPEKLRQRSISESGGGSSSGAGSNSRGRFASGLAQALRKTPPSISSGRGIEHIKPAKRRPRPKYTFAFVGSGGCGKTVLIEKGSKAANSRYKPQVTLKTVRYGDTDMTFEMREAYVLVDKAHVGYPIHAIEFNSAPFIKALETGTQFWPSGMPEVDGVVLCYDASAEGNGQGSFDYIVRLTAAFAALHYPIIWVACKSDWIRPTKKDGQPASPRILPAGIVPPQQVFILAGAEHTGLIEVTKTSQHGKEQMRNMMTWMYKAVGRARRRCPESPIFTMCVDRTLGSREDGEKNQEYHNHASPDVFNRKPNSSRPPPITIPTQSALGSVPAVLPHPPSPVSSPPKSPVSPSLLIPQRTTRARSMSDLLSQAARDQVTEASAAILRKASATVNPMILPRPTYESVMSPIDIPKEPDTNSRAPSGDAPKLSGGTSVVVLQSKYAPDPFAFATLDQLIARLLWGNETDPNNLAFRAAFALSYRRFAAPRTILLSIIRFIRGSDSDGRARAVDILADYLHHWVHKYPTDFAAPGAIPPLETLIRVLKENGFHECAKDLDQLLPMLNTLKDDATDWAKPTTDFTECSDSDTERDPDSRPNSSEIQSLSSSPPLGVLVSTTTVIESTSPLVVGDEPPTTGRRLSPVAPLVTGLSETEEQELRRVGKLILRLEPEEVAQEITRVDHELFMSIQPRDWLRHAYTTRRDRDPAVHALDQIAHRFERLGFLVDSLILVCPKLHDRGRMFEYFLRVALIVRSYNNFAALHSIVAALDKIYSGEEGEGIESYIQSSDINWNKWLRRLTRVDSQVKWHRIQNRAQTHNQPLIPTMAIHTSDLVRVMSNRDYKEDAPTLIHWGKFQIIAKIVNQMIELQGRLRATNIYSFPDRPHIASLLNDPKTMTEEMIVLKTFPSSATETNVGRTGTWGARVLRKVFSDR
ncbi:Guanine nucleotide exchange factor for Ras-like small GTPases [Rhizoctonia solani]|uniref:Guanine nucleotide exchange factor for Ras-like small GTPases n=1 Tax=Rhizoctonia solani TaxID=456999 RepID=A0A8H7IKU5_9AGAM|nr:Guanine nucleotide exchange factor for Ras-like small GTPases [Rhizoctonia solani]